jgi:general L-amino acid transport system permease protein
MNIEQLSPQQLAREAARHRRVLRWVRANLFGSPVSALVTLAFGALLLQWLWGLFQWAVLNAIWEVPGSNETADSSLCRAAIGVGACWAVVREKFRFILFGSYPYSEQWRPALTTAIFIALYLISAQRRMWRTELIGIWVAALALIVWLMGGNFGLLPVSSDAWGGLPVTLILATFGLALAFPLAVLVALGRRSKLPAVRALCWAYVELVRGVPLVTVLFMASVMFPLLLPEGVDFNKFLRAQVAFILFAGAYLSEVIRGGLQFVDKGQYEAANSIGLTYVQMMGSVVLPQALRVSIPSLVNTFIGFFKDTSLVLVIGIFDLLTAGQNVLINPSWQGFGTEVYIFIGLIYFCFCCTSSRYAGRIERRQSLTHSR